MQPDFYQSTRPAPLHQFRIDLLEHLQPDADHRHKAVCLEHTYVQIKRQIDIHHDIAVVIDDKFYVAVLTVPLVEFFMKNLRI